MKDIIMGKIDDAPTMLTDCNLPLNSFSTIGIFGQRGVGKTFLSNKIVEEFVRRNSHYKYDLDNAYLI